MADRLVVIVGGGPAGLAAACRLRELGVSDVLVVERESEAGGIPRHSDHIGYGIKDLHRMMTGPRYAAAWRERAARVGVEVRTSSTVTGWDDGLSVAITSRDGLTVERASAIVLATGCRERPRAARLVPGDRPAGVLTTGQLQQLVHLHHRTPGKRAVIVGAEHVSYSAALTLARSGCQTVAMVTEHPRHTSFRAFDAPARLRFRFPVVTNATVTDIRGEERVAEVEVTDRWSGDAQVFECDTVVFTGDWIADYELVRRHGLDVDAHSTGISVDGGMRSTVPGVFAAGNVLHPAETADACTEDGRHVAQSVAGWLATGSWPTRAVPISVESPLLWVSPQRITDHQAPARKRLVLRASAFSRAPQLLVSQGDKELWHGRVPWLLPDRPVYVPTRWLADVDLSHQAAPVVIRSLASPVATNS